MSRIGAVKTVIGADPAANAEVAVTVPAGKWWKLFSVSASLVQGLTQTPQPILVVDEGLNTDGVLGTFTVTIASPAVFSKTAHGLIEGDQVFLKTTGALPTGLAVDTIYFVIAAGLTADAFEVSATRGGAAVNTSGTQSGVHTLYQDPVTFEQFGATAAQAASTTARYVWVAGGPQPAALVGTTPNLHGISTLPNTMVLKPGSRITTNTLGKGANTNYSAPVVAVVEFDGPPSFSS